MRGSWVGRAENQNMYEFGENDDVLLFEVVFVKTDFDDKYLLFTIFMHITGPYQSILLQSAVTSCEEIPDRA